MFHVSKFLSSLPVVKIYKGGGGTREMITDYMEYCKYFGILIFFSAES